MGMPSDFEPGGDEIGSPPEAFTNRHDMGGWLVCPHPICVENRKKFIADFGEEAFNDAKNKLGRS